MGFFNVIITNQKNLAILILEQKYFLVPYINVLFMATYALSDKDHELLTSILILIKFQNSLCSPQKESDVEEL